MLQLSLSLSLSLLSVDISPSIFRWQQLVVVLPCLVLGCLLLATSIQLLYPFLCTKFDLFYALFNII
uniref:Uncharacterized protein n=1 Tax=Arundo donax TaxID=35708 RepID=A0A0A9AQF8_ARUDO